MSHKQIFGAQIKNMLDNHADQREMVLLFSLLFFGCCNEQGDHEWFFSSDWWLDGPKEDDKLRYSVYLLLLICRTVGLGVSCGFFQDLSNCSVLVWKLAQFKCFEHVVERKLSGYMGNIPFYLHGCCSCYPATRYYTSSSQMKRVLIANDLYLHIRSKPRHLLL